MIHAYIVLFVVLILLIGDSCLVNGYGQSNIMSKKPDDNNYACAGAYVGIVSSATPSCGREKAIIFVASSYSVNFIAFSAIKGKQTFMLLI